MPIYSSGGGDNPYKTAGGLLIHAAKTWISNNEGACLCARCTTHLAYVQHLDFKSTTSYAVSHSMFFNKFVRRLPFKLPVVANQDGSYFLIQL